jgi:asparagine synthase (glutamine-hydrolysing)
MLRFFGFVFDPNDGETSEYVANLRRSLTRTKISWDTAVDTPGLNVWCAQGSSGPTSGCLFGRNHAIIGRIFTRDGVKLSSLSLAAQTSAIALLLHDPREFMANHWGSYVTFARAAGGRQIVVARDPTGALPCYAISIGRLRIFFSNVHDLLSLVMLRLTVNIRFIEASLLLPNLPKRISGFHEIAEVLPGDCWSLANGMVETLSAWDPYQFIDDSATMSTEDAVETVLTSARSTVHALAGCFERINVQLGGLDSSAVLALLAAAPSHPAVNVLNLFTASPRGDERHYARLVTADAGLPLIERRLDPAKIDIDQVIATSRQLSPKTFLDLLDLAGEIYSEPAIATADASFTGMGGDSIFLQGAGYLPALDFVQQFGWSCALMPVVANAARYSRLSISEIFRKLIHEQLRPTRAIDHLQKNEMRAGRYMCLSDRLMIMSSPLDLLHPGLMPARDVPKGKCLQVLSSCFAPVEYYDRFVPSNETERVDIFLTQPMVEACLRIPSWILAHRGIDRGLERRAFASILPREIIRRRTKSTPQEIYDQFISVNRRRIVDYLLGGQLVHYDILCRNRLASALREPGDDDALKPLAILNLLQWESWLRGWS